MRYLILFLTLVLALPAAGSPVHLTIDVSFDAIKTMEWCRTSGGQEFDPEACFGPDDREMNVWYEGSISFDGYFESSDGINFQIISAHEVPAKVPHDPNHFPSISCAIGGVACNFANSFIFGSANHFGPDGLAFSPNQYIAAANGIFLNFGTNRGYYAASNDSRGYYHGFQYITLANFSVSGIPNFTFVAPVPLPLPAATLPLALGLMLLAGRLRRRAGG